MWWIFISVVFALRLYVSTRNLAEYSCRSKDYIPVRFPVWKMLLVIFLLLIPGLNILIFLICMFGTFAAISIGTKDAHDGWQLLEGKKNWVYSVVRFLQKEI